MDTTELKNCTTCKHHVGKQSIDDVPASCYPCVYQEASLGYYPNWEPADVSWTHEEEEAFVGWQGGKIIFEQPMKQDNVNSPKHYTSGGIETIAFIRAKLGEEGTTAYCLGNVLKYVTRWKDKGGLEDLRKAQWYLTYAISIKELN